MATMEDIKIQSPTVPLLCLRGPPPVEACQELRTQLLDLHVSFFNGCEACYHGRFHRNCILEIETQLEF